MCGTAEDVLPTVATVQFGPGVQLDPAGAPVSTEHSTAAHFTWDFCPVHAKWFHDAVARIGKEQPAPSAA
jgi:hypothetical protein